MIRKTYFIIFLLYIFASSTSLQASNNEKNQPMKVTKGLFIDFGVGYSVYTPKLKQSFDDDVFGVTGVKSSGNHHQNSAIYFLGIGCELDDRFAIKLEASHNSKFNNSFSRLVTDPAYYDYVVITDQSSSRLVIDGEYKFLKLSNDLSLYMNAAVGIAANRLDSGQIYGTFEDDTTQANDAYIKTIAFTNNAVTWHLGGGIRYDITNRIALSISYKYIDYGEFKASSIFYRYSARVESGNYGRLSYDPEDRLKFKLTSHNIMFGVRVKL